MKYRSLSQVFNGNNIVKLPVVFSPLISKPSLDTSDSFTSKATGNWEATGETTWTQPNYPVADDNVTVQNTHVVTQTQNEACTGLIIDIGGEVDIATFNNENTGLTTVNGTLSGGTSAGTGLTTVGITWGASSARGIEYFTKINCSGNWIEPNASLGNANRGLVVMTASANMEKPSSLNPFRSITINAGVTVTATADCFITSIGIDNVINGVFNGVAYTFRFGCSNSGSLVVGANGDFQGTGEFQFYAKYGATMTNSRVTPFTFSGTVVTGTSTLDTVLAFDFSNADAIIYGTSTAKDRYILDGFKCKDLSVSNASTGTITIRNDVNDPDIEISGDIDLNAGGGSYTTAWTKGTGTLKLTGTGQSIDLDGQDVETIFSDADIGDVTIISADTWGIGTLNLITSNLTIDGTLVIGVSADTGLTCADITFSSSSTNTFTSGAKINASGDVLINSSITFTDNALYLTQTASGSYSNTGLNYLRKYTVDVGVTASVPGSGFHYFVWSAGLSETINGTLALGTAKPIFQAPTFTIGASGDISGSNEILWGVKNTATLTNNGGTLSFTGLVRTRVYNDTNLTIPSWDWSNADVQTKGISGASHTRYFSAGTLKCKNFSFEQGAGFTLTLSGSLNPSYEISGNIDCTVDGTLNWSKGTGTITLVGSSASIDFDSQTIEDLVVSGSTKTIQSDFTTDSLDVTGVLDLNDIGTVVVSGDLDGDGTIQSTNPTNLTVSGSNNFTGVLTNVTII